MTMAFGGSFLLSRKAKLRKAISNIKMAKIAKVASTSPVSVPMATKLQGKLLSRTQINTQKSRTIWSHRLTGMERPTISARRNIRKTSEM